MFWLFLAASSVAATVIARFSVGRTVKRMAQEPLPLKTYLVSEAAEYVAANLPADIAHQVTLNDIHTVVRWHIEWFNTSSRVAHTTANTAIDTDTSIDVLVEKAVQSSEIDPVDVTFICVAHLDYMTRMGFLSPARQDTQRNYTIQSGT